MADSLPCSVCGDYVELDDDYTAVDVTHVQFDDRDREEDYILHEQCALSAFSGWEAL